MTVLDLSYDFANLSLRDLLDARDTYHYHLLSKANVIGTAVGLYLIRKDEAWPTRKGEGKNPPAKKSYARTLGNSEVRDYSWPCILAFVRQWLPEEAFGHGRTDPSLMLPKTLYMPDGRAVPVCVVEASEQPNDPAPSEFRDTGLPAFKLGGGSPIIVEVQGETHVATAGCLVTDGHLTYALTARHACGPTGTRIYSALREGRVEVGISSDKFATREAFSTVYPDFPGRRSYVSLDIGLIQVDAVDAWTSNTYGLPPAGPLADVHERNLSLRLIDQKVIGRGAASGLLHGTLKALFYRHRSVGGYDYVGDFLIAPAGDVATRHGDSGMVWNLDVTVDPERGPPVPLAKRDLRPLAIEWGGQVFEDGKQRSAYAVATSLSNACKLLDVELVTDLSRGVSGYWGREGHYSIAAFAIDLVKNKGLARLLRANAGLLSFSKTQLADEGFDAMAGANAKKGKFVPLADVPDDIWKKLSLEKGGRKGGRDLTGSGGLTNGPEHPNHYADIDAPIYPDEQTWRDLCLADDANLTLAAWQGFYAKAADAAEAAGDDEAAKNYRWKWKQGILPFRLWQFFTAMKGFVSSGDVVSFVTAAGIAAHYMGDASQPLHGSIYADGDRSRTVERHHPRTGKTETVIYAKGVHGAYESAMLNLKAPDLMEALKQNLPKSHGLKLCRSGTEVARATVALMDAAAKALPPMDILDSFEANGAAQNKATLSGMWGDLEDRTVEVMILGARYLALLWDSAWKEGNGDDIDEGELVALDSDAVRDLYVDVDFLPSRTIEDIQSEL